jgi:hypothetical protein
MGRSASTGLPTVPHRIPSLAVADAFALVAEPGVPLATASALDAVPSAGLTGENGLIGENGRFEQLGAAALRRQPRFTRL